jgi:hypothetical protein
MLNVLILIAVVMLCIVGAFSNHTTAFTIMTLNLLAFSITTYSMTRMNVTRRIATLSAKDRHHNNKKSTISIMTLDGHAECQSTRLFSVSLCSCCLQSLFTVTVYSRYLQSLLFTVNICSCYLKSLFTVTVYSHCLQSLFTVTVYSRCLQSLLFTVTTVYSH